MTRRTLWPAIAVAIVFALPTSALGAGGPQGKRAAEHALKRVQDLKKGIGVRTGRELTPALAQLAARRGALDATRRKQAAALLARPTDSSDPEYYGNPFIGDVKTFCPAGSIFCFHWVNNAASADAPDLTDSGGDPNAPDYIELMASVFDEVYACENGTAVGACGSGTSSGLGWQQPVADGSAGGMSNKFDVYIKDLYSQDIYGYAAPECPIPLTSNSCPAYMVMDRDYDRFGPAVPGETGADAMAVTAAHEYNHVLQMGYDVIEDKWMFESTATWAEEKVYPSINDYLQYLPDWVDNTAQPLTEGSTADNLKIYGSAVWNHWLDHRYGGDDVIQSAWSQSPSLGSFAPDAYGKSIRDRGGAGFPDEFAAFAAAVAEWRAPGSGFPDLYPDVPTRPGLPVDIGSTSITLDHTTFAFRDIQPPAAGLPIAVSATLPPGLKGAIALVGRTGSSDTAGTVTTKVTSTSTGGRVLAVLPDAASFGRITAVFVNADPSKSGFSSTTGDWIFTRNAQTFSGVRASTSVPPSVTTTSASNVSSTAATLNGSVNPNGSSTTYSFEYGTSTAYGSTVPSPPVAAGNGTTDTPVSAVAGALVPGTTYHYRLVAQSPGGTETGNDQTFTTPSPPVATTGAATGVGVENATLNATVDPRGSATTYVFEYGTSTAYGRKVPLAPGAAGSASAALAVATPVTGLRPGTTFHFRVVATNSSGTATGADATLKTIPLRVVATVSKTNLRKALARGLKLRPRCNANCSIALQLLLPAKLAKKLHVKRAVATGKVATGPRGKVVTLRFAKKIARRLASQRTLALSLKMTAKTKTGGKRVAAKAVRLR
jgi:hypothetical protein